MSFAYPHFTRSVLPLLAVIAFVAMTEAAAAESATPDPAAAALEQLRAANVARGELARESAAWVLERQRLLALIAATGNESKRLEQEALAAESARDAARAKLAAIGSGSELDALRERMAEAGRTLRTVLAELSQRLPPGAVPPIADSGDAFDAVVKSLDAAERSANAVAVEVITGTRDGAPEAVKVLRVSGAAAWWVSLDGKNAGTLRVASGVVQLDLVEEPARQAIRHALAQVEGRAPPSVVLLRGSRP